MSTATISRSTKAKEQAERLMKSMPKESLQSKDAVWELLKRHKCKVSPQAMGKIRKRVMLNGHASKNGITGTEHRQQIDGVDFGGLVTIDINTVAYNKTIALAREIGLPDLRDSVQVISSIANMAKELNLN